MIYAYRCPSCHIQFDVVKSYKDIDVIENCDRCGEIAERQFVPEKVFFSGTQVENAEYNPGLGCVVKSKRHRQEIAKRKGLIEIGNDYKSPETIHKQFEQVREDKRKKRWEED